MIATSHQLYVHLQQALSKNIVDHVPDHDIETPFKKKTYMFYYHV